MQDPDVFEEVLREKISVSSEFVLPISVLVLRVEGGWSDEAARRALDALRAADLVCRPEPDEILIALPNTTTRDVRVVEKRLRETLPEAAVGVAPFTSGDTAEDLIKRARSPGVSEALLTLPMVLEPRVAYYGLRRSVGGVSHA